MIPELDNERTVVSAIRTRLHQAMRRRTWRFKRNARLNALLPLEHSRRFRMPWAGIIPAVAAMLLSRA